MSNPVPPRTSATGLLLLLGLLAAARAEPATDEQLLKEVKAPDGFAVTLFARPPMMNYPVFVSAAPDGTVYVSSDGNGSLGRDPHRGRILRLRDTDGDGKADEVKTFVADVDSPRGLAWDHDRLYLIHPPHLSCYVDADGDGVAEKETVLVKNCGFTFKDRPADHTTNGLELGADGWLYVTQGDFGFLEAEGTDGRKLQFRGGGIWRVRTDGTGLEMYAYGTRNIVEAGISPLLDLFARDNTNDGGGWDVRFHHFTGLEDHGYPKLYMNFADEIVPRLADYGGGSGCGGCFIDEPGFPAGFTPAHYSADWGHGTIYRHSMAIKGATFEVGQEKFIQITRATDLDVDAFSHVYACSWRGAVFNWAGPDVGFIARVTPRDYRAEPLPDFARASASDLVKLLLSPSHRRRLEAQRTLVRRGLNVAIDKELFLLARSSDQPLASRVAAVFALKQGLGAQAAPALARLAQESPTIQAWALRALTDREDQLANVPSEPLVAGTRSADPRVRREAAVSLARLGKVENAAALVPLLGDPDVVIAHTAYQALVRLDGHAVCFGVVDRKDASPGQRTYALRVLQQLHEPAVVDGLIARLGRETDDGRRRGLVTALCRLARVEGVWKGDSWGTRPDTRGPYYQPEAWAETPKIEKALADALAKAPAEEAEFQIAEFKRHRINPEHALDRLAKPAAPPAGAPIVVAPVKVEPGSSQGGLRIADMKTPDVIEAVLKTHGDAARGPQLLLQQACVACHTTKKDEAPKGPFLGNVASIYKRRELAEHILMPNQSIAMGFATHVITLKDGTVQTGFVVREAADEVTIRTVAAQEVSIPVRDIAKREKMERSIMPEQLVANLTVQDFASLLDYLEQLAKQP